MKNKLSHSQLSRYLKCGYSHYLHYSKKLKPKTTSAALLFGSALDEAINELLKGKRDGIDIQFNDVFKVFEDKWLKGWVNRNLVDLPTSTKLVYAESDLDQELLTEANWFKLAECQKDLDYDESIEPRDRLAIVISAKKMVGYRAMASRDLMFYNYASWLCLYNKAALIIRAYHKEVLPRITKVIEIQKKIELADDNGDTVVGYVDLIAELDDGNTYILDNKSAGRAYDEDAVQNSAQLSLYGLMEGIENAGFIVYLKAISKNKTKICSICEHDGSGSRHKTCNDESGGKRCGGEWVEKINPEAKIQILTGKLNHNLEDMVLENVNQINTMIKNEIYFKNLDSCNDWYGGKCPYYSHCHNKDDSELEVDDNN